MRRQARRPPLAAAAAPRVTRSPGLELEGIDRRQPQDLCELVERAASCVDERRVTQVFGREPVAVVLAYPALELVSQCGVDEDAGRDRCALRSGQRDAKPQTRGSAAISHALPQIERQDLDDRAVAADELVQVGGNARVLAAFGWRDQQIAAVRPRQQLGVEEIGCDGVRERYRVGANDNRPERGSEFLSELGDHALLRNPRVLVTEQQLSMTHSDDIVVEDAGVDGGGELLREYAVRGIDPVTAR